MSEQGQPGWWRASDGNWYPPEQAPGAAATPPPPVWGPPPTPPPSSGMPTWAKVLIGLVVGFFLLGLVSIIAVSVLGTSSESHFSSIGSAISGDGGESSATTGPPAEIPAGYVRLQGDGVSLAMPKSWKVIDAADMKLPKDKLAEIFPNMDPDVANNAATMFENGAVLVAFDSNGGGFADNLNVLELPGEAPLGQLKTQVKAQLEQQLGGTVESVEQVQLPIGPAVRVEYTGTVAGTSFHGVQLYVPVDGKTYVVTLSSGQPVGEVGDTMGDTFTVE